jgi:hypothetical protein
LIFSQGKQRQYLNSGQGGRRCEVSASNKMAQENYHETDYQSIRFPSEELD